MNMRKIEMESTKKRKRTNTVSLKIQYILNKFYFQIKVNKLYKVMMYQTMDTPMAEVTMAMVTEVKSYILDQNSIYFNKFYFQIKLYNLVNPVNKCPKSRLTKAITLLFLSNDRFWPWNKSSKSILRFNLWIMRFFCNSSKIDDIFGGS